MSTTKRKKLQRKHVKSNGKEKKYPMDYLTINRQEKRKPQMEYLTPNVQDRGHPHMEYLTPNVPARGHLNMEYLTPNISDRGHSQDRGHPNMMYLTPNVQQRGHSHMEYLTPRIQSWMTDEHLTPRHIPHDSDKRYLLNSSSNSSSGDASSINMQHIQNSYGDIHSVNSKSNLQESTITYGDCETVRSYNSENTRGIDECQCQNNRHEVDDHVNIACNNDKCSSKHIGSNLVEHIPTVFTPVIININASVTDVAGMDTEYIPAGRHSSSTMNASAISMGGRAGGTIVARNMGHGSTSSVVPGKITLNLGGHIFKIKVADLQKAPESKLARLTHANAAFDPYKNQYFFDRGSSLFSYIVAFFHTGELHFPHCTCGIKIKRELEFWNISEYYLHECCFKKLREHNIQQDLQKTIKAHLDSKAIYMDKYPKQINIRINPYAAITWRMKTFKFLDDPFSSKASKVCSLLLWNCTICVPG